MLSRLCLITAVGVSVANYIADRKDRCTSMVFGKHATKHGHPVATHTNDCADCDARIAFVKSRTNTNSESPKGRPVYDGSRSLYPRLVSSDRSPVYSSVNGEPDTVPLGYVPEPDTTYSMYESFYPLISSAGVGIGESTTEGKSMLANQINGHFVPNTNNTEMGNVMFTIGELMKVAMEQASTARAVIQRAGDLCVEYGFGGEEWATSEAVSVVDSEEAWVMEVVGSGYGNPSCLWAAKRVPDDHVAMIANNMVIKKIHLDDDSNYMYSSNLLSRTKELGISNLEGRVFHWYASVASLIPLPEYSALRAWRIFSQVAPSLNLEYDPNPENYPFSVKVDKPLSIAQIMDMQRDHYQGTEFDMTQGVLAGPFQSPNLELPGLPRSISIMRTSYTAVVAPQGQLSKVWVAMDQPMTSVFVPFFTMAMHEGGDGEFDPSFGSPYGPAQQTFNRTTAWWAFDFVANWMNLNYQNMSLEEVYPARDALQEWVFSQVEEAERSLGDDSKKNAELLAKTQTRIQKHVTKTWWELADKLVVRYNDGFYNFGKYHPEKIVNIPFPVEWLRMAGYNEDFRRPTQHWFMPAGPEARETANTQVLLPAPTENTHQLSLGQYLSILTAIAAAFIGGAVFGKNRRDRESLENVYHKL